jgi:conjugative relaxase-like TrwC/TraI family protein
MLIAKPIGAGVAGYYFRGQEAGTWLGRASGLLGLCGAVSRHDLTGVLHGRRPGDGVFLPGRQPARRRAGWDLTFAAPKSLSLLSAVVNDESGAFAEAHRRAVADAFQYIESSHLGAARTRAPGGRAPVLGGVAAAFQHRTNASAEPHLHTHVLVANLGLLEGGEWSALSASDWWPARRSLAAVYQMGLRHYLRDMGWDLDWRLRPDGRADLADVPRAAIRAASYQGRAAAALGRSRSRQLASPLPWQAGVAQTGLHGALPGPEPSAAPAPGPQPVVPSGTDRDLSRLVTGRLLSERSTFRRGDVLTAMAACSSHGMTAEAALGWVDRFLADCQLVPPVNGRPRWTTGLAADADARLTRMMTPARTSPLQPVPAGGGETPAHRSPARDVKPEDLGLVEILAAPDGQSNLLAQAALIEHWRSAWDEAGLLVGVRTGSPDGAARWRALTGLASARTSRRPDVLVVDHADRLPTPELLAVLSTRIASGVRTVLVEGGTRLRRAEPASAGFERAGLAWGRLDPGPEPDWSISGGQPETGSSRAAATQLLETWLAARLDDKPGVLVGLGPDEVRGLNQAARSLLRRHGLLKGPSVRAAGREYRTGDGVVALGGQGSTRRKGTLAWNHVGATEDLRSPQLARVGHAYAATPALATRLPNPVLLLGDAVQVPLLRHRIMCLAQAGPGAQVEGPARQHRPSAGLGL